MKCIWKDSVLSFQPPCKSRVIPKQTVNLNSVMTKNNVFLGFPLKKTPLCTNAQLEYVKNFSASI